uniref:MYB transcription factor n=1 Tax=Noccaea caerulescens TaxID=107243 RepID=A0A1J3G5M8_NOCCA
MGNQKLKWTAEEEETLLAGVRKHGPGKWKNILRDPDFAEQLSNRSNIDLKDKWRNLSVAPGIQGSKDKIRTPKIKAAAFDLASAAAAAIITPTPSANCSPVAQLARSGSSDLSIDDSCNSVFDSKNAPRYDGMIFEALSASPNADGSDVSAIYNFIEQHRHEVPPNFKRVLSSRLRRLAAQKKLVKTQNFYKMNGYSLVTRTSLVTRPKEINVKPRQTNSQKPSVSETRVVESSATAAFKLSEVDSIEGGVDEACVEEERVKELKEAAEYTLELAIELHDRCSQGEIVELAWV